MYESFPKKGKKSSRPGKVDKDPIGTQRTGNPYFFRHDTGGDEKRVREIYSNDYGKKAQKTDKVLAGFPVSPRRTMITGS